MNNTAKRVLAALASSRGAGASLRSAAVLTAFAATAYFVKKVRCATNAAYLTAVEDTTISGNFPHTPMGKSHMLLVGGGSHSLVKFDLSGIPAGVVISKAWLIIKSTTNGEGDEIITTAVEKEWDEATTLNSFGKLNVRPVDLLEYVKAVHRGEKDYGLLLSSTNAELGYYSREAGESSFLIPPPTLYVEWESDEENPSLIGTLVDHLKKRASA